jgi:hypothetical protein
MASKVMASKVVVLILLCHFCVKNASMSLAGRIKWWREYDLTERDLTEHDLTRRIQMSNRWLPNVMLLCSLALAACQPVQAMPVGQGDTAKDAANAGQCSLATLKGRYLFATTGLLVPPGFGVTEQTPAQSAGFHIFNGDGTGKDIVTFRVNGETILEKVEVPLTYTVNADCTGDYTVDIENGPTFGLYVAPNGDHVALISTNPGNYVSTIDPRVASK